VTFRGSGYVLGAHADHASSRSSGARRRWLRHGYEIAGSNEPTRVSIPPEKVRTKIVDASPEQKQILLSALSGVGDRRIAMITVAKADADWGVADGVGLDFTPRPEAAGNMRMSWEAELVGDAFAQRSRELGLAPVAYIITPESSSAIGDSSRPATEKEVRAFVERLESEANRVGAKMREVELLKPLGYAIAATVEVSEPAEFLDRRAPGLFQRVGEPPRDYDLRFVDSKGEGVSENWNAGSGGSVWVRKDLEGCSPYLVSHPVTYKPPPCPDQSPSRQ
jgi:hypothetical protein